tara:strand:- start:32 stop:364 length:333 start_codon:yes stop_codon:yes gene_type:complete
MVTLCWHSECYNTNWTEVFSTKSKAMNLMLKHLRKQASKYTKERIKEQENENEDINHYIIENEGLSFMTDDEVRECDNIYTLNEYCDGWIEYFNRYHGEDEYFSIEMTET